MGKIALVFVKGPKLDAMLNPIGHLLASTRNLRGHSHLQLLIGGSVNHNSQSRGGDQVRHGGERTRGASDDFGTGTPLVLDLNFPGVGRSALSCTSRAVGT
jgi:hypothetical protein